jgi:hypothetical protein
MPMSITSRIIVLSVVGLAVSAPSSQAQGLAPLQTQLKQVYGTMLGSALPKIALGEAAILEASGKKDDAAKLRAAADKMTQASSQDPNADLYKESTTSVSEGAQAAADTANATADTLSSAAKKQFLDGVEKYVGGVAALKNLKDDASALAGLIPSATKGLSFMDAARARGTISLAKAVATGIPDVTARAVVGLAAIKAYAASRNIQIPANILQGM